MVSAIKPIFCRPFGTCPNSNPDPGVKTPGYFQVSLRDPVEMDYATEKRSISDIAVFPHFIASDFSMAMEQAIQMRPSPHLFETFAQIFVDRRRSVCEGARQGRFFSSCEECRGAAFLERTHFGVNRCSLTIHWVQLGFPGWNRQPACFARQPAGQSGYLAKAISRQVADRNGQVARSTLNNWRPTAFPHLSSASLAFFWAGRSQKWQGRLTPSVAFHRLPSLDGEVRRAGAQRSQSVEKSKTMSAYVRVSADM
jgi:hypothetical protein